MASKQSVFLIIPLLLQEKNLENKSAVFLFTVNQQNRVFLLKTTSRNVGYL